jgi:hypothetical protein
MRYVLAGPSFATLPKTAATFSKSVIILCSVVTQVSLFIIRVDCYDALTLEIRGLKQNWVVPSVWLTDEECRRPWLSLETKEHLRIGHICPSMKKMGDWLTDKIEHVLSRSTLLGKSQMIHCFLAVDEPRWKSAGSWLISYCSSRA